MLKPSLPTGALVAKWPLTCLLLALVPTNLAADVIYFRNGSVLVVEQAWEEGESVSYRTSSGVRSVAKSLVLRIQAQQATPAPAGRTGKYGIASESSSSAKVPLPLGGRFERVSSKPPSEDTVRRLRDNIKADPSDLRSRRDLLEALNAQASLQVLSGDLNEAQKSLQEALSLDNRDSTILFNSAYVYYRLSEYRLAEDLLLRAAQIQPNSHETFHLLGETYYAQDKLAEAISAWKTALRIKPDPQIQERLTKAQEEAGAHNELGVLQSAHFILRYDRKVSDYRLGQDILVTLEQSYRRLSYELMPDPPATITVILYTDQAFFDITEAPAWSGALYDGKIRVPVKGLSAVTEELNSVLIHELTHSFISPLGRGRCPTWLNEGIAQLMAGETSEPYRKSLRELRRQNALIPLSSLSRGFAGLPAEVAQVAYLEGLSCVEFLVERKGKECLRRILELLRQNDNLESALQKSVGLSSSELEKQWLESLQ
ncbi:MAG: hypothetical protein AB1898_28875 [Acidobacteriota bacterium]